jgi:CheY-like chemotaxis protein
MGQARLNLKGVSTLLIDGEQFTRGLIARMLRGFGMDPAKQFENGETVKAFLKHNCPDLILVEAVLPDMPSAELINWIRKQDKGPTRFVPIIVLTGYTQMRTVAAARDAGANNVVKKPVSPQGLFDRITWVARVARPFIEAGDYVGPDRRFRQIEPPDGKYKRDTDNAGSEEGSATESGATTSAGSRDSNAQPLKAAS